MMLRLHPLLVCFLCFGCYTLPESVSSESPEQEGPQEWMRSDDFPDTGFFPSSTDDFQFDQVEPAPQAEAESQPSQGVDSPELNALDGGQSMSPQGGLENEDIAGHSVHESYGGTLPCDGAGCDVSEGFCPDGQGPPNACGECGSVPEERCNYLDDDCDGTVDEGVANSCGDCAPQPDEACNNRDDDCDERIDEDSACGVFVQTHCRLFVGWADSNDGPPAPAAAWGQCPRVDRMLEGDTRCIGTRGDGRFARLPLDGNVGRNDDLGFALICNIRNAPLMPGQSSPAPQSQPQTGNAANQDPFRNGPSLAAWVQSQCGFFFAYADDHRGFDDTRTWGMCPDRLALEEGYLRCTSTGFDGQFRNMGFESNVDGESDLAVMWQCKDARHAAAANRFSEQVEVVFGWSNEVTPPADGAPTWGPCPQAARGEELGHHCISTNGDQRFHRIQLSDNVDDDDYFGIAIRAR